MAFYDYDATPSTAVAAWLQQFTVGSDGSIVYDTVQGDEHTFHVYWIHRSLQKIAYDLATSGDDELNLSYPNPSKSEAIGTIITLYNHTTDYSVNYTVTDEVMTYHFGGSVSQNDGDDVWSGLQILGKTDGTVPINIIQDHGLLTSHWGNGKNQTDSNTLARLCIKTVDAGSVIDNYLVHVRLNKWLYSYSTWGTTLGLGEKVASVSAPDDPQNTTSAIATVRGYDIGTASSYGYSLIDLDTTGTEPYFCQLSWGTQGTKKGIYEYFKAVICEDSTDTLFGVDGKLWTGRLFDVTIGSGTGTWVQSETLSWGTGATAGTGNLVAVDDTAGGSTSRLVLHLNTGVFPADTLTITGNGAATGVVSGTPAQLNSSPNFTGTFTGAWIGEVGVGFTYAQVTSADSFKDLNAQVITPPNNVPINGTVTCVDAGDAPHVMLAKKDDTLNSPEYDTYSCSAASSGASAIVVDAISADVPQAGYVGVLRTGTSSREYYEYDSWSGTTFNLTGTLAGDITATDPAHVAIFYEAASGGGVDKTVSNSLIYSSPINVIGWVRQGDEAAPDIWQPISGQIGSGGYSFSVTLTRES